MSALKNFLNSIGTRGNGSLAGIMNPSTQIKPIQNSQNSSALSVTSNPSATSTNDTVLSAPKNNESINTPAAKDFINTLNTGGSRTLSSGVQIDQSGNVVGGQNNLPTPVTVQNPPANTGSPTPNGYDVAKDNYTSAYKDYISSLAPSTATTQAKTDYNDFVANAKLGINNLTGQGRGIPLALVRGNQAKLQDQAETEATRLQGNIGIAQGNDTALQNKNKAGVDLQSGLLDLAKQKADAAKPISIGANSMAYQLNPQTGKYEQIPNTGTVGGVGGLSSDATNFWAQAGSSGVNLNNLIPSLGMGAAAVQTKQALLEKMASNANALGIDGSTFGAMLADSKAKTAAYSALQKTGAQTQVNEGNANKDFTQLIDLSNKVAAKLPQTGIPILQNWINTGAVNLTGDADVNNFMGVLTTALTEYAKVVSGATTGAGVTEGANAAAQKLLNSGLTPQAIQSFADTAKQEMANRTSSYDQALRGLFGNLQSLTDSSGGLGGGGTNSSTTNTSGSTGGSGNIFDF